MTAVIEQRLRAYERKNAICDDMTLLVALRELLAAEEERDDCDWDAVSEMTDAILTLEGEDVDSFEETAADAEAFRTAAAKDRAADANDVTAFAKDSAAAARDRDDIARDRDDIARDRVPTGEATDAARDATIIVGGAARPAKKLKWIIPIAAALTALLVGGAIAGAYLLDLFTMDADTYKSIPVGAVVTSDSEELEKTDSRVTLGGYDELDGTKYASLLVPSPLPDSWSVKSIVTDELSNASLVETIVDAGEGRTVRIKALLGLGASLADTAETVGSRSVVIYEYDGAVQGEFTNGDDYYLVMASDRALLEEAISCMEAMK